MTNYSLILEDVTKVYGRRLIFNKINFSFTENQIYGIAGHNGSGKSTLAKILIGTISATKGKVVHSINGSRISSEKLHNHIGFVAPYLFLYDEFSAEENLKICSKIRGIEYPKEKAGFLLNEFNLYNRRHDYYKAYSSGMKQRIKFIFSLIHSPNLLIFDEPTSNLDSEGKEKVYEIIKKESKENIVIVASNEESDLNLCSKILFVEKYKNMGL